MKDFISTQIDISERLFKVMLEDHKERMNLVQVWAEMNYGLMQKLDQRDEEIKLLQAEVAALREQK